MKRFVAILFFVLGCSSSTPPPPAAQPNNKACVDECVLNNQMRAVSAQQIESDCEQECSKSK
jgi:hypothetical protein